MVRCWWAACGGASNRECSKAIPKTPPLAVGELVKWNSHSHSEESGNCRRPLSLQDNAVTEYERNSELCRLFVSQARGFFAGHPEIQHAWSIDGDEDHAILEITGKGDAGFDIMIEIDTDEITFRGEGWHGHYLCQDPKIEFVASMLGLLRDLLSPSMRIRERLSNGTPYKWTLENFEGGTWVNENTCGVFFWNRFGKKTEKVYCNKVLPSRPDVPI
jgi:hypothetical protein